MLSLIELVRERPAFAAVLIIPAAVAAVLVVPLAEGRGSRGRWWLHAGLFALFLCYVAAVSAVILWPFPVESAEICKPHRVAPSAQLVPFHFLADAIWEWVFESWKSVARDLAEAGANALLFVPLGLYLGLALRWRFGVILAIASGCSLALELTQLTGVWGAYSCAYRRFDIDDVITNIAGAAVGATLALVLRRPRRGLDTGKRPPGASDNQTAIGVHR